MAIRSGYAVHCDFCPRIGPWRPQSHEARRDGERAGYVEIYCDFYGNETWVCPDCKFGDKARACVALMRGEQ